ncbi:unnamed protein product, partial [Leptidea sinapis]
MGILTFIFKKIFRISLYLAALAVLIVLIPNLPPYTKFSSITLVPTKEKTDQLSPNSALNNVQKLYKNNLLGPEAFQVWKNEIYTSLATGEIVKLSPGGHVTFVTKIGKPCTGLAQEHICGRPLGFIIDERNNYMYVADAYYGIWKVDLKSDKKQLLVSPQTQIEGRTPKLFNSVALDNNNGLYWTDSSADFMLKDGVFTTLSDPSGRLLYYNLATKENKVLLDNIWFPNGIAVSPDNSFIVLVETLKYRLLKYYIAGPKKGTTEVFYDGLPGVPDNIRVLPDGSGVQVALYLVFDANNPLLMRSLAPAPIVRKLFARVFRLLELPFEYLNTQFPHPIFEDIVYKIGHFGGMKLLSTGETGLVLLDWSGNVLEAYYNNDGSVTHISDAIVYNDKLLLGCPHHQNFVGAVPAPEFLKRAYLAKDNKGSKQNEVKAKQPKPSENKVKESNNEPNKITIETTTAKPVVREQKLNGEKQSVKPETTTEKPKVTTTAKPIKKEAEVKPEKAPVNAQAAPKVIKET